MYTKMICIYERTDVCVCVCCVCLACVCVCALQHVHMYIAHTYAVVNASTCCPTKLSALISPRIRTYTT